MRDAVVRLLMCVVIGVVLGFLAAAFICFFVEPFPADAQGVGIFTTTATGSRTSCSQLTDPVTGQTICFDITQGAWTYWNGASFTQAPGQINIVGGGPHLIGWGDATVTLANSYGILYNGVVVPVTNGNGYGLISAPNFTKSSSGVHPVISGTELDFPHITSGSGSTITTLAAVRVGADNLPPYSDATNVYGLWVVNGQALFQGGNNAAVGYPAIGVANNQMLRWLDSLGATANSANIYQDSSDFLSVTAPRVKLIATSIALNATQTFFNGPTTGAPTCTDKCGTNPSVIGTNTSMRVTMGSTGTPRSPFLVLFNGTWNAAPSCIAQLQTATTTTVSVTNSTTTGVQVNTVIGPSQGGVFSIHCLGVQ